MSEKCARPPSDHSFLTVLCGSTPLLLFSMALSSSPLVLLFAFSFVCLLIGTLLLTGGDVTAVLFVLRSSHASTAHLASSVPLSSSPLLLPLPLQRLWDYQTAWPASATTTSTPSSLNSSAAAVVPSPSPSSSSSPSSCYSSFPLSPSRVYVSVNVDDPLANQFLSGDTGHQLLQWLAGVHLAHSLRYSFLTSPIFPSRPHWDAFVGCGSGEKRVSLLQLELGSYQQQHVSQKTVAQLAEALPAMAQVKAATSANSPLVLLLGELSVRAVAEDTVWLNDTRLLRLIQRKYCTARLYRPLPVDLFAVQRANTSGSSAEKTATTQPSLYLPAAFIVAVHVECDQACDEAGGQERYVQHLADNTTAVLQAVAQLYAAAASEQVGSLTGAVQSAHPSLPAVSPLSPLHLFVHLFADRSAIGDGKEAVNDASRAATLSLASQLTSALSTTSPLLPPHSVHTHLLVPTTWAIQHYVTANALIGNLKGLGGTLMEALVRTMIALHYLAHPCPLTYPR